MQITLGGNVGWTGLFASCKYLRRDRYRSRRSNELIDRDDERRLWATLNSVRTPLYDRSVDIFRWHGDINTCWPIRLILAIFLLRQNYPRAFFSKLLQLCHAKTIFLTHSHVFMNYLSLSLCSHLSIYLCVSLSTHTRLDRLNTKVRRQRMSIIKYIYIYI